MDKPFTEDSWVFPAAPASPPFEGIGHNYL